jgi:hypothetical protein
MSASDPKRPLTWNFSNPSGGLLPTQNGHSRNTVVDSFHILLLTQSGRVKLTRSTFQTPELSGNKNETEPEHDTL